jgi:hypothetical protein
MTDIDPATDIEVRRCFAEVTVRIPLAGHVSDEWLAHYKMLARKRNMPPVQAEDVPDRSWIIVRLRAGLDRAEVQAVMDAARGLISETDAAEQSAQAAETESAIRDWWNRQRR